MIFSCPCTQTPRWEEGPCTAFDQHQWGAAGDLKIALSSTTVGLLWDNSGRLWTSLNLYLMCLVSLVVPNPHLSDSSFY